MKIVMFSINPLFQEIVTGGASKHLFQIAQHLGTQGHSVDIYCAQSKGEAIPFQWGRDVKVYPVLPFNLPFPQPYAVSAPDLAVITDILTNALQKAVRFYIHDGEWLIPDTYEAVPTIMSFRDNIYPESVLGSFIGKADEIICVSDYSRAVIRNTAGRFFPWLSERMVTVNNGIDIDHFKSTDSTSLAEKLDLDPKEKKILLHPHRPETGKGLPETIQVVDRLVHQKGLSNIIVLVPEWIGEMVSSRDSAFYNEMMRLMRDLDVEDYFKFIPWQPIMRMPELYSLGDVTLCLGNIVEAFGNVAYESLACGTPSLVSRVGVHRTLMPDDLINKVSFGDIDGAVDQVLAILEGDHPPSKQVQDFIQSEMNFSEQVETYSEIIIECKKRKRLQFSPPKLGKEQAYIVPPWCYLENKQIYHDFHGSFQPAGQFFELLTDDDSITWEKALHAGISSDTWESWIQKTWLIPQL